MRKIAYFMVAIAAIATVISCSNDENFAEVQQPQANDTGIPFTINASVEKAGNTRAKDATTLSNFQLYAVNGANAWISGITFTKGSTWEGDWGKDPQPNWPDGESTFYGISNNTATAPSFTGTITNGSFTYELPTDVDNGQEDLMVGKTTGTASTGANISFRHVLGAVTGLNFKLNCLLTGVSDADGTYLLIVKDIAFCNLITTGEYAYETGKWNTETLADAEAWEAVTTKETIMGTLPGTINQYLVPENTPAAVTKDDPTYVDAEYTATWNVSLNNNVYLLPQSNITPWDPGTPSGIIFPNNPEDASEVGAYLRIKCVFAWADEDFADDVDNALVQPYVSDNDPDNFEDFKIDEGAYIYVPFSATSIGQNKGYTLNINLIKAFVINGSNQVVPIIATADMSA